ncbi:MAG: c-type cytochrome [Elusimicrobiota bacterium]
MESWHEDYKRRYALLKESGKSFFPYAVFKDACVAAVILGALFALALLLPPELEPLADPTDAHYNPRPEWYFLFLFQALKFFPGRLEAVAAIVLPVLFILLLMGVPWLDRGPRRHPLDRPLLSILGLGGLAGFAALTWAGLSSPMTNPAENVDPNIIAGRRLYEHMNCMYCHSIRDKGGTIGPALDKDAAAKTQAWLIRHFQDPQSVTPGSTMPKLSLLDDEAASLAAYIQSLQAQEPFTEAAPKIFTDNCAACHRIGNEGGDSGPDLSFIGAARGKTFIKKYIEDPSQTNPSSAMPAYRGHLTEVEIEEIARYLSRRGR